MDPKFSFPFQPYDIQKQFMTELYFTIQDNKLGIFESPTGTGKSLSICCGALQWLKDTNQKTVEELTNKINKLKLELKSSTGTDDWLQEEYEKLKKTQLIATLQLKLDKIKHREEKLVELKKRVAGHKTSLNKIDHQFIKHNKNNESSDIKDYEEKENVEDQDLIVDEIQIEDNESDGDEPCQDEEKDSGIKIYISSRTHSQLSQFVGEIKKTVFNNNTRVVTLASRQHFCINSDVTKLKHVNLINERCLDMQKSKSKSTSMGEEGKVVKRSKTRSCATCPYYNQNNITKLKEHMLVDIMDMEDIVKCGKQLKACPYYASRMALDDAEVILISHAGIVSGGARSGVSLKLQDNVLILDEAHGLSAALESAHCAPVARRQLSAVHACLQMYTDKYRARLSSRSLLQLNQVHFVVGKLLGLLKPKTASDKEGEAKIFSLEDFVIQAEIDHLHLRPLVEFCRNTRLAPKLHGFSMRYSQQEIQEENKKVDVNSKASFKEFLSNIAKKKDQQEVVDMQKTETKTNQTHNLPPETSAGSGLYAILDFLEMLCDRSENGRVLSQRGDAGQLKYLLLNPAEHFAEVVKQCRSVIVAGGTMEPVAEFRALLAHNSPADAARVHVVKCEHVVPPRNVLAACVARGPSNAHLNFSYENRSTELLLKEVGGILRNVCALVPGGVVCFLPSYSYEQLLHEHLRCSTVLNTIAKRKKIFREPKSAADVDQVLQKYAAAIKSKETPELNGALLLSVVGGKLSEGINFSDDLGRCVIVIGMPYPNVKSLELQEKLNYLNKATPGAGGVYYENLCMKAVNQCIGRAVRHANDYACVLLVDERYSRPQTVAALPSFVQKSLLTNCTFGQTIGSIAKFFASHKENKT